MKKKNKSRMSHKGQFSSSNSSHDVGTWSRD